MSEHEELMQLAESTRYTINDVVKMHECVGCIESLKGALKVSYPFNVTADELIAVFQKAKK